MVVHRKLGGVGEVVVLGTEDVGTAIGVGLAANGASVTFVALDGTDAKRLAQAMAGVQLWHSSGWGRYVDSESCEACFDPKRRSETAVRDADVILVSAPREKYAAVGKMIACNHKIGCLVVTLQSGSGAAVELQQHLEAEGDGPSNSEVVIDSVRIVNCSVVDCSVGIRVIRQVSANHPLQLEWDGPRDLDSPAFIFPDGDATAMLATVMDWSGLFTTTTKDIQGPLNAQLALGCVDAIAALSKRTPRELLEDGGYRQLSLLAVQEAIAVYHALGSPVVQQVIPIATPMLMRANAPCRSAPSTYRHRPTHDHGPNPSHEFGRGQF